MPHSTLSEKLVTLVLVVLVKSYNSLPYFKSAMRKSGHDTRPTRTEAAAKREMGKRNPSPADFQISLRTFQCPFRNGRTKKVAVIMRKKAFGRSWDAIWRNRPSHNIQAPTHPMGDCRCKLAFVHESEMALNNSSATPPLPNIFLYQSPTCNYDNEERLLKS